MNSTEGSPMGSNIFIVKPDDKKNSRAHADPFRHEPITQKNLGRTIFRGIRCKDLHTYTKDFSFFFF